MESQARREGSLRWGQDIDRVKDSSGLHFKTGLFILLMVMFAPLGNVLLSKGMKRIGSAKTWAPGGVPHILFKILNFRFILPGVCSLLPFFFLSLLFLSFSDHPYFFPEKPPP